MGIYGGLMGSNGFLPSGKHTKNYGKSPSSKTEHQLLLWAISIAMLNCRRESDTGMFLQFSLKNIASLSHSPVISQRHGWVPVTGGPMARSPRHQAVCRRTWMEAMRASELISCLKQTVTTLTTVTGQAMTGDGCIGWPGNGCCLAVKWIHKLWIAYMGSMIEL